MPSFALAAALVAGLASADGGYYPRVWGVAGLATCAVAVAALVGAKRIALGRREWLMLAALGGLLAWTAATATRPGLATAAVPELERGALYLAVLWAALLVVRRETAVACLGGLLTGTVGVCIAALALYLFPNGAPPNALEGRLLFQPLGYANAMGILAGMAVILALAFAVHAPQLRVRALAAGSLVPLIVTVAFSASRGAAASVVLALGVVVAADPARRRLGATAAVVLPLPLLAVWASSRTSVGNSHAEASQVARDGRIVAGLIVLLTLAVVAIAYAALRDGGRVRSGGRLGLLALGGAGVGLVAAVALGVAKGVAGTLGDRPAYWHAAWQDYLAHPVLGSGPGSFETAWLRYRTIPSATLDAHNLYLETLAELGPVGLVVLVALLALPLTAVVAARRRHPLAVAAAGAYVAFLAHAAVDWDWEMPVVTVTALVCAVVVLKAARPRAGFDSGCRPRTGGHAPARGRDRLRPRRKRRAGRIGVGCRDRQLGIRTTARTVGVAVAALVGGAELPARRDGARRRRRRGGAAESPPCARAGSSGLANLVRARARLTRRPACRVPRDRQAQPTGGHSSERTCRSWPRVSGRTYQVTITIATVNPVATAAASPPKRTSPTTKTAQTIPNARQAVPTRNS